MVRIKIGIDTVTASKYKRVNKFRISIKVLLRFLIALCLKTATLQDFDNVTIIAIGILLA